MHPVGLEPTTFGSEERRVVSAHEKTRVENAGLRRLKNCPAAEIGFSRIDCFRQSLFFNWAVAGRGSV